MNKTFTQNTEDQTPSQTYDLQVMYLNPQTQKWDSLDTSAPTSHIFIMKLYHLQKSLQAYIAHKEALDNEESCLHKRKIWTTDNKCLVPKVTIKSWELTEESSFFEIENLQKTPEKLLSFFKEFEEQYLSEAKFHINPKNLKISEQTGQIIFELPLVIENTDTTKNLKFLTTFNLKRKFPSLKEKKAYKAKLMKLEQEAKEKNEKFDSKKVPQPPQITYSIQSMTAIFLMENKTKKFLPWDMYDSFSSLIDTHMIDFIPSFKAWALAKPKKHKSNKDS